MKRGSHFFSQIEAEIFWLCGNTTAANGQQKQHCRKRQKRVFLDIFLTRLFPRSRLPSGKSISRPQLKIATPPKNQAEWWRIKLPFRASIPCLFLLPLAFPGIPLIHYPTVHTEPPVHKKIASHRLLGLFRAKCFRSFPFCRLLSLPFFACSLTNLTCVGRSGPRRHRFPPTSLPGIGKKEFKNLLLLMRGCGSSRFSYPSTVFTPPP